MAGMGAPGHRRPLLLLLPLGVFLLLLSLASLRLPDPPFSACLSGGRPCRWFGGTPAHKEEPEKLLLVPAPTKAPPKVHDAPLKVSNAPSAPPVCTPSPQGSGFRIQDMESAFLASLTPEGEVLIREYLQGWKELIKFMDSLGAAFGLISRETRSKISVLEQHRKGRHGPHYRSLQSMVAYELGKGLVDFGHSQPPPAARLPSGCRTLLRLHRALKWLELFLHKLGGNGEEEEEGEEGSPEASQMCAEAYQAALAPFHSWWVRQAAALAFLAMPSRQELLRNICANEGQRQAKGVLRATVRSIAHVYNATQQVYARQGMLDLP
ncbi:glycolipid transfer protein domain-containing protein 2 isoform X1 [Anolis sagrei]|uniref:glycolipid transfer protein domain-containing protein 2 isoform X1 n=1 Tax=Anolis sagrei TaxID=38937 RepID=UPI0035209C19